MNEADRHHSVPAPGKRAGLRRAHRLTSVLLAFALTGCLTYKIPSYELRQTPTDELVPLAEGWDREATHSLCFRYATGSSGTARDYERARYWCDRGRLLRIDASMLILGDLHYNGHGGPRDLAKAFEMYWGSAQRNRREAKFMLYRMLSNGEGVRKSPEEALGWLRQAANQEYGPAEEELRRIQATSSNDSHGR